MDHTELMIGDWVYWNTSPARIFGIGTPFCYVCVNDTYHSVCAQELRPIPMSKEFLESIGFTDRGECGFQKPKLRLTFYLEDGIFVQGFPPTGDEHIDFINHIQFVHQFQQSLRLVKLNEFAEYIEINNMAKYHYEYFVYTNNLCWGRLFIGQAKTISEAKSLGRISNKGAFTIEKKRVYDIKTE